MEAKLKTALFGYSKKDVYEYIINITDELEKRHSDEVAELKEQIARLEAENQKVTDIIHDAKLYADVLKTDAEQEVDAFKEKSTAELRAQEKRIEIFSEQIDNISVTIAEFLNDVNADIAKIKEKCDITASKSPDLQTADED